MSRRASRYARKRPWRTPEDYKGGRYKISGCFVVDYGTVSGISHSYSSDGTYVRDSGLDAVPAPTGVDNPQYDQLGTTSSQAVMKIPLNRVYDNNLACIRKGTEVWDATGSPHVGGRPRGRQFLQDKFTNWAVKGATFRGEIVNGSKTPIYTIISGLPVRHEVGYTASTDSVLQNLAGLSELTFIAPHVIPPFSTYHIDKYFSATAVMKIGYKDDENFSDSPLSNAGFPASIVCGLFNLTGRANDEVICRFQVTYYVYPGTRKGPGANIVP